jgi:predicted acylesterase/phospholipase RssA
MKRKLTLLALSLGLVLGTPTLAAATSNPVADSNAMGELAGEVLSEVAAPERTGSTPAQATGSVRKPAVNAAAELAPATTASGDALGPAGTPPAPTSSAATATDTATPAATRGSLLHPTDDTSLTKREDKVDPEIDPVAAAGDPKVITSRQEKLNAAKEATKIRSHSPAAQTEIKEELAEPKFVEKPVVKESADGESVVVDTTTVKRPTVALALGGGGARGAAHIGILKVFEQEGIPVDYIVGNSMGAIVGGLYSAGVPLNKIQESLEDKSLKKAYMPGFIPPQILMAPLVKLKNSLGFGKKNYAGLFSGDKFQKYLGNLMGSQEFTFDQATKTRFSAVALNLVDGKAYSISKGNLPQAIRASASLSPLLRPVPIDDKVYADGGIRANLPASAARDTGADVVIAVLVDEPLRVLPKETFHKLKGIGGRLADVVLAVTDEHQLQFSDIVVNPDVSGIPLLSNDPKDVTKAVIAGEAAARKALPAIRARLGIPAQQVAGETPAVQ